MKKYIVGFIIGGIIFGGIGVVSAYTILSSNVSFTPNNNKWKVSNVQEAIDSLYMSKTSDDYSTDEKRVGTWIDGKPIYQKTIVSTTSVNKYLAIAHNIDNFDQLIWGLASVKSSDNNKTSYINGYMSDTESLSINSMNKDNIYINFRGNFGSGYPIYITVKYTKLN